MRKNSAVPAIYTSD